MQYNQSPILEAYNIIDSTAKSNATVEALGSFFGLGTNLLIDAATIGTHYIPMLNKIRALFGKAPWTMQSFGPVLKVIANDLMFDFVFDKLLGSIPIAGTYFNYICAKSMIFRVGMLCAMTSCLNEDITDIETFRNTSILIREIFPQKSAFKFASPDYGKFEQLMLSIINNSVKSYEEKVERAMEAFGITEDPEA